MFYEQVVCNSLYQDNKLTKAFREKALVSVFFHTLHAFTNQKIFFNFGPKQPFFYILLGLHVHLTPQKFVL